MNLTLPHHDPAFVRNRHAAAQADFCNFERGGRRMGLNCGQYSMIDLIRVALELTGPAEVVVATWSSGIRDGESAAWFLEKGAITRMTWIVDSSFVSRQPEYVDRLRRRFGDDCVFATLIHAKFALVRGNGWNLAFRSSMNLNRNDRFELWEVDDSEAISNWLGAWVDQMMDGRLGWSKGKAESRREWKAIDLGDGPDTQPDPVSPGLSQWVD
jgi:hypothetical protein